MADEQTQVTAGGIRMADNRLRFEKHATWPGQKGDPKQPSTRPWGSQPMNCDTKTGALTGAPHPEQKPDMKFPEPPAEKAAEKPTVLIPMKRAYGR